MIIQAESLEDEDATGDTTNPNANLYNGLVAYWKLDENSSDFRQDVTKSPTYDLNPINGPVQTKEIGKFNRAVQFSNNPIVNYLYGFDDASLRLTAGSFTLGCWVYATGPFTPLGSDQYSIIHKGNGTTEYKMEISGIGGFPNQYSWRPGFTDTSGFRDVLFGNNHPTNRWNFFLMAYDAIGDPTHMVLGHRNPPTGLWLELNLVVTPPLISGTGDLYLGYNLINGSNAAIDELVMYNRFLSAAERLQLWNNDLGRTFKF